MGKEKGGNDEETEEKYLIDKTPEEVKNKDNNNQNYL